MKILAAADLHGKHSTYSWIAEQARNRGVDAVVLAGDLLGWPDKGNVETWQARDAEVVVRILEEMSCPVLYVMGNDDLIELPKRSDRVTSLHGRKWSWGSFTFVGYQYSLPFMGGVFEKPEHQIAWDLKALAPLVDNRTVFVTHSPAYGILDLAMLDLHAGSNSILEVIRTQRPPPYPWAHTRMRRPRWTSFECRHVRLSPSGGDRSGVTRG